MCSQNHLHRPYSGAGAGAKYDLSPAHSCLGREISPVLPGYKHTQCNLILIIILILIITIIIKLETLLVAISKFSTEHIKTE
uniref:Uncharacterized protein n=1 Tax=Anguilla anguilla TaxID=7936 RepID=A0A0E9X3L6_ANGAN